MADTMIAFIIIAVFMVLTCLFIIISEKWHIHKYIILAGTVFLIALVFICAHFFIKEKYFYGPSGVVITNEIKEED